MTKEARLPLFADDTILLIENPKESRKYIPELINTFGWLKIQDQYIKIKDPSIH